MSIVLFLAPAMTRRSFHLLLMSLLAVATAGVMGKERFVVIVISQTF